jgi:mono/diheme cytochrome c family protein
MMETRTRAAIGSALVTVVFFGSNFVLPGDKPGSGGVARAQEAADAEPLELAGEADYVGMTKCAACHYAQFKDWKETAHGKAHEILPTKYRKDESCLECHTTGFGQPASSDEAAAANLMGVSCEACHGPGGKHARYALTFVGQGRELTEESLKVLRSQIQRIALEQCIKCHASKAHKPHPEFDREAPSARGTQTGQRDARPRGFFQVHN